MTELVPQTHTALRKKAKEIPLSFISSPDIQEIISEMSRVLKKQKDGVAIAAPQVGLPLRIFVVSGNALTIGTKKPQVEKKDIVFINPVITSLSKEKAPLAEGCLSVRLVYGKVPRSKKVELTAYNEKGKVVKKKVSGLMAQIFQHECDHLDGILFIDKAIELEKISQEEFDRISHVS